MASSSFKIDTRSPSLFEELGHDLIFQLSTKFYDRVFADDDPEYSTVFSSMFKTRDKENAIRNQAEFFIQRFGGPPLYSNRKGHPALRGRHAGFSINTKSAERWLFHMRLAMQDVGIKDEQREALEEFFFSRCQFSSKYRGSNNLDSKKNKTKRKKGLSCNTSTSVKYSSIVCFPFFFSSKAQKRERLTERACREETKQVNCLSSN